MGEEGKKMAGGERSDERERRRPSSGNGILFTADHLGFPIWKFPFWVLSNDLD